MAARKAGLSTEVLGGREQSGTVQEAVGTKEEEEERLTKSRS